MAYDEYLADRIRNAFEKRKVVFEEKKMMGGLCFMVENKMCLGTHIDKKSGKPMLMARIGDTKYEEAIKKPGSHPMDFTGKPMRGYIFAMDVAIDLDEDFAYWIDSALAFNPMAKASKKRKK